MLPNRTMPPDAERAALAPDVSGLPSSADVLAARLAFPAGLEQPEGSFRFSVDALLLAAYASRRFSSNVTTRFIDLGTGCGIVAHAYMLLSGNITSGWGIDCHPALIEAGIRNAQRLGLAESLRFLCGDLRDSVFLKQISNKIGLVEAVISNPPWRLLGSGRLPADEARRTALFGDASTLGVFAAAASSLLKPGGRFFCLVGAHRTADMLAALSEARLRASSLRFVHKKEDAPAALSLLEARKGSRASLEVEPPLFLYGPRQVLTPESLEFCPFLR